MLHIVLGLSSGFGILLFLLLTIATGYQVKSVRYRFAPQLAPNEAFELDPSRTVQEQARELPYNLAWEFPRLNVSLQRVIGTGNFGKVWEALAEGIRTFQFVTEGESPANDQPTSEQTEREGDSQSTNDGNMVASSTDPAQEIDRTESSILVKHSIRFRRSCSTFFSNYFRKEQPPISFDYASKVAVKCLKEDATEEDYTNFAGELKIMIRIGQHKNIVNILGTRSTDLFLGKKVCKSGSLLNQG